MGDYTVQRYFCKVCNTNHEITLHKELAKMHTDFPFPYVYLHGDMKDLVTTLYIDANLKIRGVEITSMAQGSNLFSQEHSQNIAETLTQEIARLSAENEELKARIKELEKKK